MHAYTVIASIQWAIRKGVGVCIFCRPHKVGSLLLAKTRLHSCTVFASLYTCNMQVNLTNDCGIDGVCETDFSLSVVGATYLPDR